MGALSAAERALADVRWQRDQAKRQADDFVAHMQQITDAADNRLSKVLQAHSTRLKYAHRDGLDRVQAAKDFAEAESPRLAAMALRPGTVRPPMEAAEVTLQAFPVGLH